MTTCRLCAERTMMFGAMATSHLTWQKRLH